jgi:hypothetical protein
MIELRHDTMEFSFPELHPDAVLHVEFQRTLRIPDDGRDHSLPPGLGRFPVRHVDDFADRVPASWSRHGGVMLPMYQSEAMWLNFSSPTGYPFALKVAAGKINAVSGDAWSPGLHAEPQDYVAIPGQPWLDGYAVEKGVIRQFVAMPLGSGYSAEEQLTGEAEHGGLQLAVYPVKRAVWERMQRPRAAARAIFESPMAPCACAAPDMGLAPGGRMRQTIYDDSHPLSDYELSLTGRCFVHIANSMVWRSITGQEPPTTPPTAAEYTRAGLPWFEYYSDRPAAEAGGVLGMLKGILQLGAEKGDAPLPENESVSPENILHLRSGLKPGQVREGAF